MKFLAFVFFFLFVLSLLVGIYQYVLYTVKREEAGGSVPAKHKKYFVSTAICFGLCVLVFFTRNLFIAEEQVKAASQENTAAPLTPTNTEVQNEEPEVKATKKEQKKKWDVDERNDDDDDDDDDDHRKKNKKKPNKGKKDDDPLADPDSPQPSQPGFPGIEPPTGETPDDDYDPNQPVSKSVGTS